MTTANPTQPTGRGRGRGTRVSRVGRLFERTNGANQDGGGVRDLDAAAQAGGSACAGCASGCACVRRVRGTVVGGRLLGEIDREQRAGTAGARRDGWSMEHRAWTLPSGCQLSRRSRQAWLVARDQTGLRARREAAARTWPCARVPSIHPTAAWQRGMAWMANARALLLGLVGVPWWRQSGVVRRPGDWPGGAKKGAKRAPRRDEGSRQGREGGEQC